MASPRFTIGKALDIVPAQLQTTLFYGMDAVYYLHFYIIERSTGPYKSSAFDSLLGRGARDFSPRPSVREARFSLARPDQRGDGGVRSDRRCDFRDPGDDTIGTRPRSGDSDCAGAHGSPSRRFSAIRSGPRSALAGSLVFRSASSSPRRRCSLAWLSRSPPDSRVGKRSAFLEAFAFGVAGLVVFAALDGAWLWGNAKAYGNPIFPYHEQRISFRPYRARAVGRSSGSCRRQRPWRCSIRRTGLSVPQARSANC